MCCEEAHSEVAAEMIEQLALSAVEHTGVTFYMQIMYDFVSKQLRLCNSLKNKLALSSNTLK